VLESGIRGEDVFIERLPDGHQIIRRQEEFKLGELEGHIDGVLVTPEGKEYLWEHKVCGQDKFNKAKKGISLMSFDSTYYTQAFVYMMLSGIHQHLTTVELSGGRDYAEILTQYEPAHEDLIKAKVESIKSEVMMPPLPKWQQNIYCKGCEYYDRCFRKEGVETEGLSS
jgi:CRISPR/Cas system-associated exonuclease Cas4 (RecB family)